MSLPQLIPSVSEAMTVRRVFGEPYERDGVTVLPAAAVRGGGGSGYGTEEGRQAGALQEGEGGGFGITARPAGAYVFTDGTVTWQPAVDVNRIVAFGVLGWVATVWLVSRTLLVSRKLRLVRRRMDRRRRTA